MLELLEQTSAAHEIAAVFHVAALCDYKVKRVEDDQGRSCNSPKIASRSGALTISLEPATKVIAKMRHLFAESILVGWKYELAGTPPEALAKAVRQMQENRTEACVAWSWRILAGEAKRYHVPRSGHPDPRHLRSRQTGE